MRDAEDTEKDRKKERSYRRTERRPCHRDLDVARIAVSSELINSSPHHLSGTILLFEKLSLIMLSCHVCFCVMRVLRACRCYLEKLVRMSWNDDDVGKSSLLCC